VSVGNWKLRGNVAPAVKREQVLVRPRRRLTFARTPKTAAGFHAKPSAETCRAAWTANKPTLRNEIVIENDNLD
jgi:hypothetical protein